MDIEAVLFDVGNTLFYLDYPRLIRVLASGGAFGASAPPEVERAMLAERRARVELSRYLAASGASTEDPLTFRRYVALTLAQLGIEPADDRLDPAFAELCREHRRENFFGVPAPGALATVELLARRFKLAVVSNAGGKVARKLEEKGFARSLLAVVDSGLVGIEKPDPRIFLMACEHARVRPERSVYVGDLHAIDVVGARRAGLQPVLLDPAGAYRAAGTDDVPCVADIPELAAWLGSLS